MQDDKAFSSIDLVGQCLIDEPRSLTFEKAIKEVVKPEHIVLDVGTGSGIMALFSARAGAKEVYALEYDQFVANTAKNNFLENNFNNIKELFVGDARSFDYPENLNFDVVVMELLTTGMVDEFQIQAVNNLHKKNKVSKNTIFIPNRQETYVSLANSKFNIYGFNFRMVKHLWNNLSENQQGKIMSKTELLSDISFSEINEEIFNKDITINITEDGVVNSVYLTSVAIFNEFTRLGDTETFNAPVVVPIPDLFVKKGDKVEININYIFGGGYNNFKIKVI